jgi:hypothetical protein
MLGTVTLLRSQIEKHPQQTDIARKLLVIQIVRAEFGSTTVRFFGWF